MKFRILIFIVSVIPIHITSKPVADSLVMDYTYVSESEKKLAHSSLNEIAWEQIVDRICSGDTINDVRVIDYITKTEAYKSNFPLPYGYNPLLHHGYRGGWFDNSIKIKLDGAIYELTREQRNVCNDSIENIAAAHLCDSTLSVWNVLDSIVYNGVVYRTKYVNAYYLTDKDGRAVNNNQEHNSCLEKMVLPYNPNLKVSGFSNFSSLQEIVFKRDIIDCWNPDEDDEITFYDFCFSNCSALQKIALPEGMKNSTIGLFSNCKNLNEVKFPNSLEEIQFGTFDSCDNLERIYIPKNVQWIRTDAFWYCGNLKEVIVDPENPFFDSRDGCNAIIESNTNALVVGCSGTIIPQSVTSIEHNAFRGSGIESIVIPKSVTQIGIGAFQECVKLTSIQLSSSLKTIEDNLFYFCTNLKDIELPENINTIKSCAFAACSSLVKIEIPQNVEHIDPSIFFYCPNLKSIKVDRKNKFFDSRNKCNAIIESTTDRLVAGIGQTKIPKTIKIIGNYAFYSSFLNKLTIPESVIRIEDWAFASTLIEKLFIPMNVTHIGNGAFSSCNVLTSITVDTKNLVYDSRQGCNAIIESTTNTLATGCVNTTIPQDVSSIGDCAFQGNSVPFDLHLPDHIKRIGYAAFKYCDGLKSVYLPKHLDCIESDAFADCDFLEYLSIQEIISWGGYCFANNNALKSIVFNSSISSIGDYAFGDCQNLESVVLPKGLKTIGKGAFMHCPKLRNVQLPSSIKTIGGGAFSYCKALTGIQVDKSNAVYDSRDNCNAVIESYTGALIVGCINTKIPTNITTIGNGAFKGSLIAGYLKIPNNIRIIGDYAFLDCEQIESIVLPDSLDRVGDFAIVRCSKLKKMRIGRINSWGEGCFMRNYELLDIHFTRTNSRIGESAFGYNRSLKSIVLPDGLETIETYAFINCTTLVAARLPQSLKSIDTRAFGNCKSLDTPLLPDNLQHLNMDAYYGCNNITELDIPKSVETFYGNGGNMENLRVLKLPNKEALNNLRMTYCYNLKQIIIK